MITDNHPLATHKEFATVIMSTQWSSSSSTNSDLPVVQKSSFSIPPSPSFRRSTSSAYDSLYEYTYFPEDSKILITDLPCLNPYTAIQECSELQQQGLIEPTDSSWACEAFYVNKRS